MSNLAGGVAVVVACVDCRHHRDGVTMIAQYKRLLDVEHVFLRTAAGPDGRILQRDHHFEAITDDVQLLIAEKSATVVAIVAHYECAGHDVSDLQHHEDVASAARLLKMELPESIVVVPMIAKPTDGIDWRVEKVSA